MDELVHQKLRQLQYLPSETCSDEEFLRRVYLDVTGQLPTVAETVAFLSDEAQDKRTKLIDELLSRPEFAKFWTLKWGDLLRLTKGQVGADGVHKYHRWIERAVASNMPYDEFARALLTASGSTFENPPANFFRTSTEATDTVETVSQIFLGRASTVRGVPQSSIRTVDAGQLLRDGGFLQSREETENASPR